VQRKTAAVHLASLGRVETIPALARLLQDEDGYVRSYVSIGIHRAVTGGRVDEEFRRKAYDLLLAQCDQSWKGTLNDAAETVVALDPERAAVDFARERWLSNANNNTYRILKACNRANIRLPEALTRPLLDHALRLAVGDRCYPHQYAAAAALESLALRLGEQARPIVEAALDHEQKEIREAAALGIVKLAGLEDPVSVVLDRLKEVGFDGLSRPQRVVYCASEFDAEVCNGGIMQFFGNSSGDHAAETLEALRELGQPEAEAALALAMKHVGPLAREPNRDMRLAAFDGRYEQLRAVFDPLESAYYQTGGRLRQKMLLYAVDHADHFRT
jgi:HEAT repeat protein